MHNSYMSGENSLMLTNNSFSAYVLVR